MSAPPARTRKSKIAEAPTVIVETAVPTHEEKDPVEYQMQRLTSIPIDPDNIPPGMKTQSRSEKERLQQIHAENLQKIAEEERNQRILKLVAFGASIATGAILAYKFSNYLSAPAVVIDNIVDETVSE